MSSSHNLNHGYTACPACPTTLEPEPLLYVMHSDVWLLATTKRRQSRSLAVFPKYACFKILSMFRTPRSSVLQLEPCQEFVEVLPLMGPTHFGRVPMYMPFKPLARNYGIRQRSFMWTGWHSGSSTLHFVSSPSSGQQTSLLPFKILHRSRQHV
jgi:hypothetical protein